MIKKLLFFCYFAFGAAAQGFSQHLDVDSFKNIVQTLSSDTEKVRFVLEKVETLDCTDSIAGINLCQYAKDIAVGHNWPNSIAAANLRMEDIYMRCYGNWDKGLQLLEENVRMYHEKGDKHNEIFALEGVAKVYRKIDQHDKSIEFFGKALLLSAGTSLESAILADVAYAYSSILDYPNAIIYYDSSLRKIETAAKEKKETFGNPELVRAGILLNMGDIYLKLPDTVKAQLNYEEVVKIGLAQHESRFVVWGMFGIGKNYSQKHHYAKAIEYFLCALQECRDHHDFEVEVVGLDNVAQAYLDSGNFIASRNYADTALSLAETQGFTSLQSKANRILGSAYLRMDKPELASFYLEKALDFGRKSGSLEDQELTLLALSNAYKSSRMFDKALDAYTNYIVIRDSLMHIQKTNETIRKDLEVNYKTERLKQQAAYQQKIDNARTLMYSAVGGILFLLVLSFFIYRNYNTQKKYNALLSEKEKFHLAHIEAQSNVLSDFVHVQAHEIRGPVSAIMGFVQLFNYDDPGDPQNKEIVQWIDVAAQKLDGVIRSVVSKENELRNESKERA